MAKADARTVASGASKATSGMSTSRAKEGYAWVRPDLPQRRSTRKPFGAAAGAVRSTANAKGGIATGGIAADASKSAAAATSVSASPLTPRSAMYPPTKNLRSSGAKAVPATAARAAAAGPKVTPRTAAAPAAAPAAVMATPAASMANRRLSEFDLPSPASIAAHGLLVMTSLAAPRLVVIPNPYPKRTPSPNPTVTLALALTLSLTLTLSLSLTLTLTLTLTPTPTRCHV